MASTLYTEVGPAVVSKYVLCSFSYLTGIMVCKTFKGNLSFIISSFFFLSFYSDILYRLIMNLITPKDTHTIGSKPLDEGSASRRDFKHIYNTNITMCTARNYFPFISLYVGIWSFERKVFQTKKFSKLKYILQVAEGASVETVMLERHSPKLNLCNNF